MDKRILNKAHEMFLKYGIRSVSMDEIAAQLGISKKTIYQYYADKDALVEDVINAEINVNEERCENSKQISENAIHEVMLAVESISVILKAMNPSLLNDLEKYHPIAHKKLIDHKYKFLSAVIKDNLQRGIEQGLYKPEINTDILARYRIATIFLVFNGEVFQPNKITNVVEEITDNFLYGLATTKGNKLIEKYINQRNKK